MGGAKASLQCRWPPAIGDGDESSDIKGRPASLTMLLAKLQAEADFGAQVLANDMKTQYDTKGSKTYFLKLHSTKRKLKVTVPKTFVGVIAKLMDNYKARTTAGVSATAWELYVGSAAASLPG